MFFLKSLKQFAEKSRPLIKQRYSTVAKAMEEAGLVPDVERMVPCVEVELDFCSGACVRLGNQLTPAYLRDPPHQVKFDGKEGTFYCLFMVDPDAPSKESPTERSWLHWLVGNVPGGSDIKKGEELAEYICPLPQEGAGMHRYVIMVYKQQKKLDFKEEAGKWKPMSSVNRKNFSIPDFSKKYYMNIPRFGNFFYAEYDQHVCVMNDCMKDG